MARQSLPSRALPSRGIDREPQKAYRGSITRAHCSPVAPATGSFHFESTKGAHVCSLESSKSPPKPENHTTGKHYPGEGPTDSEETERLRRRDGLNLRHGVKSSLGAQFLEEEGRCGALSPRAVPQDQRDAPTSS